MNEKKSKRMSKKTEERKRVLDVLFNTSGTCTTRERFDTLCTHLEDRKYLEGDAIMLSDTHVHDLDTALYLKETTGGRLTLADVARLIMATDKIVDDSWRVTYTGEGGAHYWEAKRIKGGDYINVLIRPVEGHVETAIEFKQNGQLEVNLRYTQTEERMETIIGGMPMVGLH